MEAVFSHHRLGVVISEALAVFVYSMGLGSCELFAAEHDRGINARIALVGRPREARPSRGALKVIKLHLNLLLDHGSTSLCLQG